MAILMFDRLKQVFKREGRRLAWFGVIGFASLGMTVGLYALVTRLLWTSGSRTLIYTVVAILVTWLNYEANSRLTFDQRQRTVGSMGRFTGVAIVATGLSSCLFWLGHEVLHALDFAVIVSNTLAVALFTFTSHRLFTFHERPWRFFKRR